MYAGKGPIGHMSPPLKMGWGMAPLWQGSLGGQMEPALGLPLK